jgi:hypothetical protein
MKALVCATAVMALAGPATAGDRYDRKLEEAVMAIVAASIGDIRGGFALDARPVMVIVQDNTVMGTTDMNMGRRLAPPEGMVPATERKTTVPTTF